MNNIAPIDENYKKWLSELSDRFRSSQIKAAVRVNSARCCNSIGLSAEIFLRWN